MNYNLNNLNPTDFESLVQALSRKIFGQGTISFGSGTDGGREAIFTGSAPFPSMTEQWKGVWVIQAKFKTITTADEEKDFNWVKEQLTKELNKYETRKVKVSKPNNYILFTNVILTAKAKTGGRDKASEIEKEFQTRYGINNIRIISCDDIRDFLNNNRDVAIAYAPFVLPGDVLFKLLQILNVDDKRNARINEIVTRFIEIEFKEDVQSKLDQAGKFTTESINLEKVFIDLQVSREGADQKLENFISTAITAGNRILKNPVGIDSRFVLVAGPGYGKSTLTQFLVQIYRANFLRASELECSVKSAAKKFVIESEEIIKTSPHWVRIPFRIILKEYAGWIKDSRDKNQMANISVLEFLKFNINKKSGSGDLTNSEVEMLFKNFSTTIVFDGLDEVPLSSNRTDVINEINIFLDTILRQIRSDSMVVATTRPQGYTQEFDESKYRHLTISDLSKDRCELYLTKLLARIIEGSAEREEKMKILQSALDHNVICRLMRSPLQASIMAILVKSGGEPPRNKFDLFTEYYETIFKREKQRNILKILGESPEYIKEIHNKLGLYLQAVSEEVTNPSATIPKIRFEGMIKEYLRDLGHEDNEVNQISKEVLRAVTDRLVFISEVEDEKVGFAIRSVQEFFAASGYIHNVSDEDIRKKIGAIAVNSYWNNTLLFVFGYLSKHKSYLVDAIEGLCYELNGSSDEKDKRGLSSIAKVGSWLALQILNEGIYKNSPKFENRFCHLIQPLFYLSLNNKHSEIVLLPPRIIEKWILKYLDEALIRSEDNQTAWNICIQLYNKKYDTSKLVSERWPQTKDKSEAVIRLFLKYNVCLPFVVERFLELLETERFGKFWDIMNEGNYDFIMEAVKSPANTPKSKRMLFDYVFLASLNDYSHGWNYVELLTHLGVKYKENQIRRESILSDSQEQIQISVVDGYRYTLVKPELSDDDEILSIREGAKNIGSILVLLVCNFLLSPTYKELREVYNYIEKLEGESGSLLRNRIAWLNSLTKAFFMREHDLKEEEVDKVNNLLRDIETRSLTRSEILDYKKMALTRTLSYETKNVDKIVEFQEKYFSSDINTTVLEEYNGLFNWVFRSFNDTDLIFVKKNQSIREACKMMFNLILGSEKIYYSQVYIMFYILQPKEVVNIFKNRKCVENYTLEFETEHHRNWQVTQQVFNGVCDTIKLQILLEEVPVYKILIQQILDSIANFLRVENEKIPFHDIRGKSQDEEAEKYRNLILILDSEYCEGDYESFIRVLNLSRSSNADPEFARALMEVLHVSRSNSYMDQILTSLDKWISEEDTLLRSDYEEFVGQYLGARPTHLMPAE